MPVFSLDIDEVVEVSLVPFGANNKMFLARKGDDPKEGRLFWMNNDTKIDKEVDNMADENKIAAEKLEAERLAKEKADAEKLEKEKVEAAEKLAKEALAKENAELKLRLEAAEKLAKEAIEKAEIEKEARLIKEYSAIAKEQLPLIGGDMELGLLLKEANAKLAKESYETLLKLFKAANEKIGKGGLFQEIGKEREGNESKPYDKITALAKELMAKDSSLTLSKAMDTVIRANPKLYEEYTASI